MNGLGTRPIRLRELEDAEKEARKKQQAINKASFLIEDAKARYIKEKTRARSKKAAMERDAELSSKRFDVLNDFDKFDDIQEAYGCDCFGEAERDRLEDLWKEREEIQNRKDIDGYYHDDVTDCLHDAFLAIQDKWQEEIDNAQVIRRLFNQQQAEAEAELKSIEQANDHALDGFFGR